MDEADSRKYWRRDMPRDWDDFPMTSISHNPTEGNNIIRLDLERRSAMVRGLEQTGNHVIMNFMQPQKPNDARDLVPASPVTAAGRNPRNFKKKKNKADVHRLNKASTYVKKRRVVWDLPLREKFIDAINRLGGDAGKAVPKKILELMNDPELTRENVASHLQKYRLNLKKKAEKNNKEAVVGSMSLPNQSLYDLYGYNGHPNQDDFRQAYYQQTMNQNEWCQSVPPYRNMSTGAQLPIPDGMAGIFPLGGSGSTDMGREELHSNPIMDIPCSSWPSDNPFCSYSDNTCTLASQYFQSEGLSYSNGFNGAAQVNTPSSEFSPETAFGIVPLDQLGCMLGFNGHRQAIGPAGSSRGFGGNLPYTGHQSYELLQKREEGPGRCI